MIGRRFFHAAQKRVLLNCAVSQTTQCSTFPIEKLDGSNDRRGRTSEGIAKAGRGSHAFEQTVYCFWIESTSYQGPQSSRGRLSLLAETTWTIDGSFCLPWQVVVKWDNK